MFVWKNDVEIYCSFRPRVKHKLFRVTTPSFFFNWVYWQDNSPKLIVIFVFCGKCSHFAVLTRHSVPSCRDITGILSVLMSLNASKCLIVNKAGEKLLVTNTKATKNLRKVFSTPEDEWAALKHWSNTLRGEMFVEEPDWIYFGYKLQSVKSQLDFYFFFLCFFWYCWTIIY